MNTCDECPRCDTCDRPIVTAAMPLLCSRPDCELKPPEGIPPEFQWQGSQLNEGTR